MFTATFGERPVPGFQIVDSRAGVKNVKTVELHCAESYPMVF